MKLPLTIAQPGKLADADGETIAQLRDTNDAARITAAVNHADALAEALRGVAARLYVCGETMEDYIELEHANTVLAAFAAAKEVQS